MEVKDLRIGNYIQYKKGHLSKVDCIDIMDEFGTVTVSGLDSKYIDGSYSLEHFEPIPLTEEWLIKFGYDDLSDRNENVIAYAKDSVHTKGFWFRPIDGYTRKLEYVHQLQNLYHALTGNELEIKE
jgi:hypothetical protein